MHTLGKGQRFVRQRNRDSITLPRLITGLHAWTSIESTPAHLVEEQKGTVNQIMLNNITNTEGPVR